MPDQNSDALPLQYNANQTSILVMVVYNGHLLVKAKQM